MKNIVLGSFLVSGLSLIFGAGAASADCDASDGSLCQAQSVSHTVDETTFVWHFNCDGDDCYVGEFLHGDPWVVHPQGGDVEVTSVTPDDAFSGLQKNPASAELVETTDHGSLRGIPQGLYTNSSDGSGPYDASLDLSHQFPFSAPPDNGVYVKAKGYTGGDCAYTAAVGSDCIDSYSALVVLEEVPDDGDLGGNTFRPSAAGHEKRFFTVDDFDLGKIPQFSEIEPIDDYSSYDRWNRPYPDYFTGFNGDHARRWAPKERGMQNYAMYRAHDNLRRTFALMADDSWTEEKINAAYSLLQYSVELHGAYEEGVVWSGGAGQHQGYWHPLVFMAAVIDDEQVVESVRSATDNMGTFIDGRSDGETVPFVELYQVRENVNGDPIWGGYPGRDGCRGGTGTSGHGHYWYSFTTSYLRGDRGKRTCGDPYGYIDGAAERPGAHYASCCSTGLYITIALMQKIWPDFGHAANNPTMVGFVERLYDQGWSAFESEDNVAKPDPRESQECEPWTVASIAETCDYFGKTWGHNPDTGTYISIQEAAEAGHPDPGPRWEGKWESSGRPSVARDQPGARYWDVLTSSSRKARPTPPEFTRSFLLQSAEWFTAHYDR